MIVTHTQDTASPLVCKHQPGTVNLLEALIHRVFVPIILLIWHLLMALFTRTTLNTNLPSTSNSATKDLLAPWNGIPISDHFTRLVYLVTASLYYSSD